MPVGFTVHKLVGVYTSINIILYIYITIECDTVLFDPPTPPFIVGNVDSPYSIWSYSGNIEFRICIHRPPCCWMSWRIRVWFMYCSLCIVHCLVGQKPGSPVLASVQLWAGSIIIISDPPPGGGGIWSLLWKLLCKGAGVLYPLARC